jgi:hypothetical protein
MEKTKLGFRDECSSSLRQIHFLVIPLKQPRLEKTFKILNLFGQRWLRNVQPYRGS